jgi:tetratricopeptide (TPR) repeat protein
MYTCKLCHQNIYETFIKTGMGKSFEVASKKKSSANFSNATIFDQIKKMQYHAYWQNDSLYISESKKEKDFTHQRTEKVDYIIGSGQHTNSHLQNVNGYINQMPMTFYTQKQKWDLPPGFEEGFNTRFSRKIGLECMTCHNAYPEYVIGSENKFSAVPNGIDCERCHGPGSIHVAQRQTGSKIDTSKYIDYSIVNPAKLSIDAQFDICQRCHLQGNGVLKNDHSFFDYKPGMKLSDYISVFLPKYKNADDEFIMASHADRLKQSMCFIKSIEKVSSNSAGSVVGNTLKPYKDAMTCITCHNPHVSVKETNKNVFNDACLKCHGSPNGNSGNTLAELEVTHQSLKKWNDCVSCHMPLSGSIDIPHVTVHDHYIRKPITQKEKNKIKTFVGLFSINEKNPDELTKANAYIQQYEKFEQNKMFLDSAKKYLKDKDEADIKKNIYALVKLNFMKQNFEKVIFYINKLGDKHCYEKVFKTRSYDNKDAWASYQIGESYLYSNSKNSFNSALKWLAKAVQLAPYNLDFKVKYGAALAQGNLLDPAIQQFEMVINENPKIISAYANLGYVKLMQGKNVEAINLYESGLKLDPDYEPLLLNLAGYYAYVKNYKEAKIYLQRVLKLNPENKQAKQAFKQLMTVI